MHKRWNRSFMSTRARHHCFLRRVETDRLDQQQHGGHRLQPESLWIRLIKAATSNTDLILTIHCSYFFRHIHTQIFLKFFLSGMVKLKLKKNNNTFRISRNFTWFLFYWNPDGKGLSYQENERLKSPLQLIFHLLLLLLSVSI